MYRLPSPEVIDTLSGRTVDQVCICKFSASLVFDGGDYIGLMTPVMMRDSSDTEYRQVNPGASGGDIARFAGDTIASLSITSGTTISIAWRSGAELVLAGQDRYESFEFMIHGKRMIV